MKNKVIKMFALCVTLAIALVCSVNITLASAASAEDTEAPVIYGVSDYTISNISLLDTSMIINSLEVVDNVDEDLKPEIVFDNYTNNYKTPGQYYITFKATDSAGNVGVFKVIINVVDITAPCFYNYQGKLVNCMNIYKSRDSVLLIDEVVTSLTARDNEDGVVSITLASDEYTGNGDKKGTYKVVLTATDSSNNITNFEVLVNVTNDMPDKTIVFDSKIIIVESNKKLSNDEFAKILKVLNMYDSKTVSYTYITSGVYENTASTPGDYLVGYKIQTTSGNNNEGTFSVRVVEARSDNSIVNNSDGGIILSALKAIGDFLWSIVEGLIGLFK